LEENKQKEIEIWPNAPQKSCTHRNKT